LKVLNGPELPELSKTCHVQPKGAARSRQADDMAASLPDEQLWLWMTHGSASAKTGRQQRKGALT